MNTNRITNYLETHHVHYTTIPHPRTCTAQQTAASVDVPGREMAKTVMVKIDGMLAMAVMPAPYQVDLHLLRKYTGAKFVELAEESEFTEAFPDCEMGAMPPFGNLYGMEVFVDTHLTEDASIVFNAGSLTELIKISYWDYARIVKPTVVSIAVPIPHKLHKAA